ncbi:hypothetical protein [Streptomyces sp. NPDC048516]|uniref:hypothetical protein n=1 Tax=Streptomyces sp. NPDC048516 TaxID=3365565 RepID=UPI003711E5E4
MADERLEVLPGDLLFSRANTPELVGSACIATPSSERLLLSDKTLRLVINPELADARFTSISLAGREVRRQIEVAASGSSRSMQNISQRSVENLNLLWPLVEEQRRIVEVLDAVTEAEHAGEAIIAKLGAVRDAAVESMLGHMDWGMRLPDALGAPVRNGFSPVESAAWTGVQMLGLGCLTPRGFCPRQLKNAPVTVAVDHPAVLADGDLLMSRANTRDLVGLVGVYRGIGTPCIYPDLMMRVVPSERTNAGFLELVLRSSRARRQITGLAQGTSESMVKISGDSLKKIAIPLPALDEQARLLRVVGEFEKRIAMETEALAKLRTLHRGLTDDLLSGRVRVGAVA